MLSFRRLDWRKMSSANISGKDKENTRKKNGVSTVAMVSCIHSCGRILIAKSYLVNMYRYIT